MTPSTGCTPHPPTRTEHRHALDACRTCRACTQELVTLREQWDNQSRALADLQALLAVTRHTKEAVGKRPAPAA